MCDTLSVHISGCCFGEGVYVDTLAVNRNGITVWQIIWMLLGEGDIM